MSRIGLHGCNLYVGKSFSGLPKLPPGSHWIRSVWRKWRKLYLPSESHVYIHFYLKSHAAILAERRRHARTSYWYIMHPLSPLRFFWQKVMLFILLWSFVVDPVNAAFLNRWKLSKENRSLHMLLFASDCFCLVDVFVTLHTGYYEYATKQLVLQPSRIYCHYLKQAFLTDFISSLPIQNVCMLFFEDYFTSDRSRFTFVTAMGFLPIIRIIRFKNFIDLLHLACNVLNLPRNVALLLIIGINTLLFCHWLACINYLIPRIVIYMTHDNNTWISITGIDNASPVQQYLRSATDVHITLFNAGFGFTEPACLCDLILKSCFVLIGFFNLNIILVLCLQIISITNSPVYKYEKIKEDLYQFMINRELPIAMKKRLIEFYEYRLQKKYFRENVILNTLSDNLRADIEIFLCRRFINTSPLFVGISQLEIDKIAKYMQTEMYLANDVIIRSGTSAQEMYFINKGSCYVISPNGNELHHLEDGDHFGEIALLPKFRTNTRLTTVIADTTTEVYRLSKAHFQMTILTNKVILERLENIAYKHLLMPIIETPEH